jgi:endonuclease YncB( thermonuclease family)
MNFRRIVTTVSTAAFALMLPWSATAADYLGKVTSVADGDTFTMESETGKVRVRICGIDAPERGQPGYGQAAGNFQRPARVANLRRADNRLPE